MAKILIFGQQAARPELKTSLATFIQRYSSQSKEKVGL